MKNPNEILKGDDSKSCRLFLFGKRKPSASIPQMKPGTIISVTDEQIKQLEAYQQLLSQQNQTQYQQSPQSQPSPNTGAQGLHPHSHTVSPSHTHTSPVFSSSLGSPVTPFYGYGSSDPVNDAVNEQIERLKKEGMI